MRGQWSIWCVGSVILVHQISSQYRSFFPSMEEGKYSLFEIGFSLQCLGIPSDLAASSSLRLDGRFKVLFRVLLIAASCCKVLEREIIRGGYCGIIERLFQVPLRPRCDGTVRLGIRRGICFFWSRHRRFGLSYEIDHLPDISLPSKYIFI
ncbi:hypothetical protein K504DRAFT_293124 [Pleomassaria siparia CBS 279.74]|uniref:Uncharacterized protein n=1 Tax=Pleomassaria siparia CBS 279.74 TaxID=1314801 RepID=A0A6G1K837_9PLEO|nr:hypothetical protein K504DRAFT_293124 [Pleomassaria siparia CBS 279.74]